MSRLAFLRPFAILLAPLGLFLILLLYSLRAESSMYWLFCEGSYYLISLMMIIWVYSCYRWFLHSSLQLKQVLKDNALILAAALAFSFLIYFAVGPGFKVLSDETNLIAVSKSMLYEKTVYNTTMGFWYYDNFWAMNKEIPTRPLAFPYLIHLLHWLFGYSVENAFRANGILLFFLLGLVGMILRHFWGKITAISVLIFFLSQPILSMCASSGGYDLLSCFLQALSLALTYDYLTRKNEHSLFCLWMSMIVLAHVRYEGFVFLPSVFLPLLVLGHLRRDLFKPYLPFYLASPLLLVSRFWQIRLTPGKFENPEGVPPAGFEHFQTHAYDMLLRLVDFSFEMPFATVLNLISLVSIVLFLIFWVRGTLRFDKKVQRDFFVVLGSLVGCGLTVYLSHHFGYYAHPTQSRLFLVFVLTLPLLFVLIIRSAFPSIPPRWFLFGSLFSFLIYHPISLEQRFPNKLILIRETNAVMRFLNKLGHKNFLLVVERPGQYTAQDVGAVDFNWAQSNSARIISDFRRHLYQDIYVVENINYDNPYTQILPKEYTLESVYELQNTESNFLRISKLVK